MKDHIYLNNKHHHSQDKKNYLQVLRGMWPGIDLEQYAQRISECYGVLELPTFLFTLQELDKNISILKKFFIEPYIISDYQIKPEPVLIALSKKGNQHVIILGNSGSGKSTLVRYLLLNILNPSCEVTGQLPGWLGTFKGHLPLLVELGHYRELVESNQRVSLLECCYQFLCKIQGIHFNLLEFKKQLKVRPSLIIFDGLNEVEPCKREKVTQAIINFTKDYALARVVVTSRIVGYQGYALQHSTFHENILQDLQPAQIKTFVQDWFEAIYTSQSEEATFCFRRIFKKIQHSTAVCQLATNPLLLTMMVSIAKHQELPERRIKLYEYVSKVLCHHWKIGHIQETLNDLMDEKLALLRHIAWRMQATPQKLSNTILKSDLQDEIENDISKILTNLPSVKITSLAHATIAQLSEYNLILCQYDNQSYGFVHRSFLEYFCATEIVARLRSRVQEKLTPDKLKTEIFLAHYQDETWHEVLRFICGMVEPQLAGELINTIIPIRKEAFAKTEDLILAVQCLAEVVELNQINETARRVLKSLCGWFEQTGRQRFDNPYMKENHFEKNAILAVEMIGTNWPGREKFLAWLSNPHKATMVTTESSSCAFGRMVAALWSDYEETKERLITLSRYPTTDILPYMAFDALARSFRNQPETQTLLQQVIVNEQRENMCNAAVRALAMYYTDVPETLLLLQQLATEPKSQARNEAIWYLAEYYTDIPSILPLFQQIAMNDQDDEIRYAAISALASNYTSEPDILPLFNKIARNDKDSNIRNTVITTLAEKYTNVPETFSLLWQFATNKQESDIRNVAIRALAKNYTDMPDVLSHIIQIVTCDPNDSVRSTAVNVLAKYYTDVPEILSILQQVATHDQERLVRSAAIRALAEYYTDVLETLPLLQKIARNDQESLVRNDTISVLAEYYTNAPEILSLLRKIAIDDQNSYVRYAAIWALAEYYTNLPDTLLLLQQIAAHDPENLIRSTAIRVLGQYYSDVPDILSGLWEIIINGEDACLRQEAVGGVIKDYDEIWQKLLSQSLDETWPWLDSKQLIDEERINQAAEELELSPDIIRQHYEAIAKKIPLRLFWLNNK